MKKKVFIGVGHGGSDPGVTSNGYRESQMNLEMALACKDELERHGVEVKISRVRDENDPLSEEIRECNSFNPDLAIDVHNNAGGGDGFEIFYYSGGGTSKTLALNIEEQVKLIGQNSRGIKTKLNSNGKDYFGFIREIKAPSVIAEGVFIDNSTDMTIADTKEKQRKFGVAYAKGILKTLGISYIEPNVQKYAVLINSYGDILKAKGIACMLKHEDNLYSEVIPYDGKYAIKIYPLSPLSKAEYVQNLVKEKYDAYSNIIKIYA